MNSKRFMILALVFCVVSGMPAANAQDRSTFSSLKLEYSPSLATKILHPTYDFELIVGSTIPRATTESLLAALPTAVLQTADYVGVDYSPVDGIGDYMLITITDLPDGAERVQFWFDTVTSSLDNLFTVVANDDDSGEVFEGSTKIYEFDASSIEQVSALSAVTMPQLCEAMDWIVEVACPLLPNTPQISVACAAVGLLRSWLCG